MADRTRTYGDSCGIARALDRVGDRWALLIARELIHGPKRFTDLRAGLPGVGPDMLSQRLRELEAGGVLTRRTLLPPSGARVYELSKWGSELAPVLLALGRFGSRAALPAPPSPLSVDAAVMALETTYRAPVAPGSAVRYGLHLGDQAFELEPRKEALLVRRGPARSPAVALHSDPETLVAVLWHGQELDAAIADGRLTVHGDRAAAERLLEMFPAPVPAA